MAKKKISRSQIITKEEFDAVEDNLRKRAEGSINARQNLVIYRLAVSCGLKDEEISQLRQCYFHFEGKDRLKYSCLRLPAEITHNHRPRVVPLYWDLGTIQILYQWSVRHMEQTLASITSKYGHDVLGKIVRKGKTKVEKEEIEILQEIVRRELYRHSFDYFVTALSRSVFGKKLDVVNVKLRYRSCLRILGKKRQKELPFSSARHTFIYAALKGGQSPEAVAAATGLYLNEVKRYCELLPGDDEPGNIFTSGQW